MNEPPCVAKAMVHIKDFAHKRDKGERMDNIVDMYYRRVTLCITDELMDKTYDHIDYRMRRTWVLNVIKCIIDHDLVMEFGVPLLHELLITFENYYGTTPISRIEHVWFPDRMTMQAAHRDVSAYRAENDDEDAHGSVSMALAFLFLVTLADYEDDEGALELFQQFVRGCILDDVAKLYFVRSMLKVATRFDAGPFLDHTEVDRKFEWVLSADSPFETDWTYTMFDGVLQQTRWFDMILASMLRSDPPKDRIRDWAIGTIDQSRRDMLTQELSLRYPYYAYSNEYVYPQAVSSLTRGNYSQVLPPVLIAHVASFLRRPVDVEQYNMSFSRRITREATKRQGNLALIRAQSANPDRARRMQHSHDTRYAIDKYATLEVNRAVNRAQIMAERAVNPVAFRALHETLGTEEDDMAALLQSKHEMLVEAARINIVNSRYADAAYDRARLNYLWHGSPSGPSVQGGSQVRKVVDDSSSSSSEPKRYREAEPASAASTIKIEDVTMEDANNNNKMDARARIRNPIRW